MRQRRGTSSLAAQDSSGPSYWATGTRTFRFCLPCSLPPDPCRAGEVTVPRYDLALFWGVPAKPLPTRPAEASQHGSFYPASGGRRAVVKLLISGQDLPRVATPAALRILARHGIPTRIE
jgi:hypothetical protein